MNGIPFWVAWWCDFWLSGLGLQQTKPAPKKTGGVVIKVDFNSKPRKEG